MPKCPVAAFALSRSAKNAALPQPMKVRCSSDSADRRRANQPPRLPTGISFSSEASHIARIAREVIVVGPGDMHTAHSDRECVPVAELEEWTQTLRVLLS